MDNTKIIVVEDNIVYCEFVCNLLARKGFRTVQAFHLSTAKKYLQQAADGDIVVSDLRLPDGNGIDLLRWMRKEGRMQPFIIMTDYAEVHTAVESMKLGSLDYIPKQLVEDKLVPLLRTILKERNIGRSRMPLFSRDGSAFQAIMKRIRLVAPTDMSVLIFGENGTGKEHIAHLLHDKGKRAGKPFVAVDCGSLTKELAPSAFFGHVRGAFTGADSTKKGYFHEAEGGTLFLDEVGNLAPETQQMLLRAIQERRYRPVGDKSDRSFNVRIIAATNEDLEKAVHEKRFRQDLLYRLHDFKITVPPLRDCQEDVMPLAEFFREIANRELECDVIGFDGEARKTLLTHAWPGNVRELRQKIMHRIRLVAPTDMSVLIFGENGTGKEHIAHLLHDKSKRSGKPFVAVDCGSLTKELAPSAFFGHVKGAFTGAENTKKGYFHEAEGGTLFLDEVGNLAPETQQMLLRAIQERRFRPVGDKSDRSFNVRIIAATNENLEKAVNEKRFRQDLLYRLHDFEITVLPLRDCQEDIMPLAEFFREIANKELECKVSGFSSEARKALLTHSWPGNVRELRQKIMGAVLQAQTGLVTKEHLELGITETTSVTGFSLRNDEEDKERILRALKQADGNRKVAAELLGIGRTTLYNKLEEYGLKYKFEQP